MERRLAAILAADVVGYSRMMGADEAATLEALRHFKTEHLGPVMSGQKGRIIKSMGDGWLVEFSSVVDAVTAAMQLQDALTEHPVISLRIGVHIGDITHADEDIFGDGVNIASRLEALADPGGVAISEAAYGSLDGTLRPSFDDQGEQSLKNIARPVRVWARLPAGSFADKPSRSGPEKEKASYPELTIVPFQTSDPRQEVQELAEALTSDLRTYLSQLVWLKVQIAVAETRDTYRISSVLRARGDRLRLEVRLDNPAAQEIWAQKFDGSLADSFDWQDETAEEIAAQLIGHILDTETRRLTDLDPAKLTAEQCHLVGIMSWRSYGPQSYRDALEFHQRAIEANPELHGAYAEAIIVLLAGLTLGYDDDLAPFRAELPKWVQNAQAFRGVSAALDLSLTLAEYMDTRNADACVSAINEILRRAPFDARLLTFAGWSYVWSGRPDLGLDCHAKGLRFGRFSPFYVACLGGAGTASIQLGRPEDAIEYARRGLELSSTYATFHSVLAAGHAMLDQMDEARAALERHMELTPRKTLASWKVFNNYGGSAGGKRYFEALSKAGMPEA